MRPVKGRCSMSPAEDAALLLNIVRRHLVALRLGMDPVFPAEDWGFTAQQALEKLLKAQIVLADRAPPRRHDLGELAALAEAELGPELLERQVFACLLYTSPSPRDRQKSRMPSSA